eukprot:CAMPEP_0197462530 /NCGR_PEP_ID=MMETSP1175-20131217/59318_1 /TAXON_ID=1003142 /ORGANISM="Triceratium dubium, Strain CCMP147" /LENGTH=57 /DNA_ID=CAMNT_0042998047 /DNA_START=33 /DNA_END=202 /DNA_ORIENTATION=-
MNTVVDPVILQTVQLLEYGGSLAYLQPDVDLYEMMRCRLVRLLFERGLFDEAGITLA